MNSENFNEAKQLFGEVLKLRGSYQTKAASWVQRLSPKIDQVAYLFRPEELMFLLASYELTPWSEIRDAELTDFNIGGLSDDDARDQSMMSDGLQHILARRLENFMENVSDFGGAEPDDILWCLADGREDAVAGTCDRLRMLTAEETVALIVMLEFARALPHGIRAYPNWWTSAALLGVMRRADRLTPWKRIDASHGECIAFGPADAPRINREGLEYVDEQHSQEAAP